MIAKFRQSLFWLGLFVTSFASADPVPIKPVKYQGDIGTLVSNFMALYHYEGMRVDDRISKRLFDNYLDALDYNRLFFLESDILAFKAWRTQMDDDLRESPVVLDKAFAIYNRYRIRVNQRVDMILSMINQEFDFTQNESYYYDRHKEPWARTEAQLKDIWRRRLKEEIIRFRLQGREKKDYMDVLEKRYNRLRKQIKEDEAEDVLERYLTALTQAFDPHSTYFKPISKDNFDIQMGHSLEGIGASLVREGEYTVIVDLLEGGPAIRSGEVQPDDKIIAVAQGKDGEFEDVVDMRVNKVVKKIRGKKGTVVRLRMIPADAADLSQVKEVSLVRDRVELTSLDAKAEVKEVRDKDGRISRLGVIEIPSFYMDSAAKQRGDKNYKSTTRDVRKLLKDLETKSVDGIVVDLRRNGGGSLDEAIELTGLFIHNGPIVQVRNRQKQISIEKDPDEKIVYDGPLLVLTSVFSASASEIFAGAIQDYDRGVVVGSQSTHGKGTVQQVISLETTLQRYLNKRFEKDIAGALKLTTHKFYRVSGGATQFKGVIPDVTLPSPYDGMKVTEDQLDYALPWDEINPAKHKDYDMVHDVLPVLKSTSMERVALENEFRYVREDVKERERLEKKNFVSLNLETREKEKDEREKRANNRDDARRNRTSFVVSLEKADDKKEENKDEEEAEKKKKRVAIPDYVLEEALYVLRDYIQLKKGELIAGVIPKKDSL